MSLPKNIDPSKSNPDPGAVVLHDESPTTCCATITGKGRSAIAVVAIRGSSSRDLLSQCFEGATKGRFSPGEIRYGVWIGRTLQQDPQDECATAESVVITPLDENHFEIHCHGGPAAIGRIMEDLQSLGATAVQRDEWPPSSEILLVNEATVVLARCVTARTAAIAMDQVRGALLNWAKRLLASLEHDKISTDDVKRQAERIVGFAEFTTRMAEPFRVVLLGPPNVGKSSLLNAIVGFDRSITLDAAGTTRDVLHADTVIDGLPIRLSDTAGIRDSDETIEQLGMGRARNAAAAADLVLGVTEPALAGRGDELELDSSRPLIRVLNKADLLADHDSDHGCEITTNALSGEGVEGLLSRIASRLGRSMPPPSEPAPINDRQAERLRELSRAGNAAHSAAILRELIGVSDASGVQR